jgi:hypothetical protein
LTLEDIFTDERRIGTLYPPYFNYLLEKEIPLLVRRAEPKLISIGEISSVAEERLFPMMRGNIFLGSYSLNDFFLVCCMR